MKYPFIIFDWDGTLIDSELKIIHCMQAAARDIQWQPELTDNAVRNIIGLGLPEAICALCPGISEQKMLSLKQRYSYHFLESSEHETAPFQGVTEGLKQLRNAGHQLAVATGKSRRGLNQAFEETGLKPLFIDSRCADETRSKPDPLMLNELLQKNGFSAEQSIMIGDTEFDMALAQNAGMDRVAVSYGAHHADRLQKYAPSFTAHQFSELTEWILNST